MSLRNDQRYRRIDRRALNGFLERLTGEFPPGNADTLGVRLVSDRRMRGYNERYRGRAATTDVLAFPGDDEPDPEGSRHLGDIVISVPRADVQARERGHSLTRELQILLLHGYLHLMGYDHETDDGAMLRLQRRLTGRLLGRTAERAASGARRR